MSNDRIANLTDEAAEKLREALRLPPTPDVPSHLYDRCGNILYVLAKLRQLATTLCDTTERAPLIWTNLGSDDETPAAEHVDAACLGLIETAAAIDDAYRYADEAFSSLSHLKIRSG
jgi:hypothetical protein